MTCMRGKTKQGQNENDKYTTEVQVVTCMSGVLLPSALGLLSTWKASDWWTCSSRSNDATADGFPAVIRPKHLRLQVGISPLQDRSSLVIKPMCVYQALMSQSSSLGAAYSVLDH
jgi:hypothetical protein